MTQGYASSVPLIAVACVQLYTGCVLFQEVRQSQQAQFLNERNEDEMDLSDTETEDKEPLSKKRKAAFDGVGGSLAGVSLSDLPIYCLCVCVCVLNETSVVFFLRRSSLGRILCLIVLPIVAFVCVLNVLALSHFWKILSVLSEQCYSKQPQSSPTQSFVSLVYGVLSGLRW